jgi:dTDP-4-amino-4,6-dideoxygalactose transaminase
MIVTNNKKTAKIVKALRVHGSGMAGAEAYALLNGSGMEESNYSEIKSQNINKYNNYIIGHNSRLDELQATILRVKLRYLDKWNNKRRSIVNKYYSALKGTELVLPIEGNDTFSIYHLYVIKSKNRNELISELNRKGISTGVYYRIPVHLQKAYQRNGYFKGDFPVAEYLSEVCLAIPIYPELSEEEVNYITDSILEFLR